VELPDLRQVQRVGLREEATEAVMPLIGNACMSGLPEISRNRHHRMAYLKPGGSLATTLWHSPQREAARRRLLNSILMMDQTAIHAGFDLRRWAVKPMPALRSSANLRVVIARAIRPNDREQFTVGQHFDLNVAALDCPRGLPVQSVRALLDGGTVALRCFLGQFNGDDPQPTALPLLNVDLTG
jgi:hypothetical protein